MPASKKRRITITLTRANSAMAEEAARLLKIPVARVISSCLAGSTNPKRANG